MIVRAEQAMVYRTPGGRRFLTKRAAYEGTAWERIRAKYQCDCCPDEIGPGGRAHPGTGNTCERHADIDRFRKVAQRLGRFYARADRAASVAAKERAA